MDNIMPNLLYVLLLKNIKIPVIKSGLGLCFEFRYPDFEIQLLHAVEHVALDYGYTVF